VGLCKSKGELKMREKVVCEICGWHGTYDKVLIAQHPFNLCDKVQGCQECLEINSIWTACNTPYCHEMATCGTSTKQGYKRLCSKHYGKLQ